ncbi:hypothetical protein EKO04_011626 [Ascochyta lentis]|uniref:Uncharacterized protein n=1 Tax=Ascochyta lentis TaxID=205686 RepID=A0A8H7IUS4_9PLEO|nr:hypothetical protein EKO04_011626 [Ascochyta lentis]
MSPEQLADMTNSLKLEDHTRVVPSQHLDDGADGTEGGEQPCCVTIQPDGDDAEKVTEHDGIAPASAATDPASAVDGASPPATPLGAVHGPAAAADGADCASAHEHMPVAFEGEVPAGVHQVLPAGTRPGTPASITSTSRSVSPMFFPPGSNDAAAVDDTDDSDNNKSKENAGKKPTKKKAHQKRSKRVVFIPGPPTDDSTDPDTDSDYSPEEGETVPRPWKEKDYSGYRKQLWASGG